MAEAKGVNIWVDFSHWPPSPPSDWTEDTCNTPDSIVSLWQDIPTQQVSLAEMPVTVPLFFFRGSRCRWFSIFLRTKWVTSGWIKSHVAVLLLLLYEELVRVSACWTLSVCKSVDAPPPLLVSSVCSCAYLAVCLFADCLVSKTQLTTSFSGASQEGCQHLRTCLLAK